MQHNVWLEGILTVTAIVWFCLPGFMGFTLCFMLLSVVAVHSITGRIKHSSAKDVAWLVVMLSLASSIPISFVIYMLPPKWFLRELIAMGAVEFAIIAWFTFNEKRVEDYRIRLRGKRGEAAVRKVLEAGKWPALHDVYLRRDLHGRERASQVDHIALVGSAIVCIETKNVSGDVLASDDEKLWTLKRDKDVSEFRNPVLQNAGHVDAVLQAVQADVRNLVVFTDLAEFPRGLPRDTCLVSALGRRLNTISKETSVSTVPNFAWGKLKTEALDRSRQASLKELHAAWMYEIEDTKGAPPRMPRCSCQHCGNEDLEARYTHSHYWRCADCGKDTSLKAPEGWHLEIRKGVMFCSSDDNRREVRLGGKEAQPHEPDISTPCSPPPVEATSNSPPRPVRPPPPGRGRGRKAREDGA